MTSRRWRFTQREKMRRRKRSEFDGKVEVDAYGNVLSAMCALHGLASEELTPEELDHKDRNFDVIVTVRAVRAG